MTEFDVKKCESCSMQSKVFWCNLQLELKHFNWLCSKCLPEIERLIEQNEKRTKKELGIQNKGMLRFNEGKTEFCLLYMPFIEEMAKVMMFGRSKGYPKDNWKQTPKSVDDVDNSRLRHCISDIQGEVYDSESKLTHLAHEAINCMIDYFHTVEKNEKKKN